MLCAGLGTVRDAVGIVQETGRAAADIAGLPHAEGEAEKLQNVCRLALPCISTNRSCSTTSAWLAVLTASLLADFL